MGWRELMAWLKVMRRQQEGKEVGPDSWEGADRDPFWVNARRQREEERRSARGF